MSPDDHETTLTRIEISLHEVARDRALAEYRRALGEEVPDADRTVSEEAAILNDPDYRGVLALPEPPGSGTTADEGRRLELHRRRTLAARVRTDPGVDALVRSLAERIRAFENPRPATAPRPDWRRNPGRAVREEGWFRFAPIAERLETDVSQLLSLRNERAAEAGFPDFAALLYEAAELSRIAFMGLCDELEQVTRETYEQFLTHAKDTLDVETLEPWDLEYVLAQIEPELPGEDVASEIRDLAARMGFDPGRLPALETIHDPLAAGARCVAVSIPDDVRVLVSTFESHENREEALRAFGRGLYRRHLGSEEAFHWEAPGFARAMGEVLLGAAEGPGHAGGSGTLRHRAWRTWRAVLEIRRNLAAALFEMLAYERPEGDLHSLYSEVGEHYLGFPRHPERLWVAQDFLITRPLRAPNYIMSRLIGAQVLESLGPVGPATGRDLVERYWKGGARVRWQEKLERSTGKALDPEALLSRIRIPETT